MLGLLEWQLVLCRHWSHLAFNICCMTEPSPVIDEVSNAEMCYPYWALQILEFWRETELSRQLSSKSGVSLPLWMTPVAIQQEPHYKGQADVQLLGTTVVIFGLIGRGGSSSTIQPQSPLNNFCHWQCEWMVELVMEPIMDTVIILHISGHLYFLTRFPLMTLIATPSKPFGEILTTSRWWRSWEIFFCNSEQIEDAMGHKAW